MKFLPRGRARSLSLLALVAVLYVALWSQRTALMDWAVLRSYTPPTAITALADQTTMTDDARHFLYINRPVLANRETFNKHCTNEKEDSVVLGCYTGNRNGIYVFNVTDSELDGVKQVTTAHEMLHQAYDRLSTSERNHINQLLRDYYEHDLTDESVKSQIEAYKKSEPDALDNEMHSLFGTEIATLPSELETYYARYFTDRSKVAGFYTQYQAAFTTRKAQIADYDQQLVSRKATITTLQQRVQSQLSQLDSLKATLESLRATPAVYNQKVVAYNAAVASYNSELERLKVQISEYNDLVTKRNAIADQEQHLQQSLSSKSLPDSTQE